MTAHTYDTTLAGHHEAAERHSLRGAALVTMLVILMAVAAVVLATAEWITPVSAGAVPG